MRGIIIYGRYLHPKTPAVDRWLTLRPGIGSIEMPITSQRGRDLVAPGCTLCVTNGPSSNGSVSFGHIRRLDEWAKHSGPKEVDGGTISSFHGFARQPDTSGRSGTLEVSRKHRGYSARQAERRVREWKSNRAFPIPLF